MSALIKCIDACYMHGNKYKGAAGLASVEQMSELGEAMALNPGYTKENYRWCCRLYRKSSETFSLVEKFKNYCEKHVLWSMRELKVEVEMQKQCRQLGK